MKSKVSNSWQMERKITLGSVLGVITLIVAIFSWEYAQTAGISSNTKDIHAQDKQYSEIKESIKELKQSVKDVDKKTDEIKTLLIKR